MVGSVKESASVFVGNLPFEATQEDISALLSKAGHVVNVKIQTYSNGKPKGWGLVEFSSIAEAKKAIAELNRGDILGRKIHVHNDRSTQRNLKDHQYLYQISHTQSLMNHFMKSLLV